MDPLSPKYILPAPDVVRRGRIEAGAGIYLLEGAWHFAALGSEHESALVAAGGLRIGTLRFDRDPRERSHPWRGVEALGRLEAARRFGTQGGRN